MARARTVTVLEGPNVAAAKAPGGTRQRRRLVATVTVMEMRSVENVVDQEPFGTRKGPPFQFTKDDVAAIDSS